MTEPHIDRGRSERPWLAIVAIVAIAATAAAGCAGAEHRPARDRYNAGIVALEKKDYDAAEKALLEARDQAKVDPELRYRAAFNLGLALAAHADALRVAQPPDAKAALEKLRQAAGWFNDALRLRGDDPDARAALARVKARTRALADELARGENGLEVRLDRLIEDQRKLRDEIQAVWLALDQAGATGRDPLAGHKELTLLADRERGILTDAGVVGDLAGDEIDTIGKKPDEERTDEQKVRVVQLQNLDMYLQEARSGLSNARRKLQELTAGPAYASAENALAALKRAREQLLHPITALEGIAADELGLYQETDYLVRARQAERDLTASEPPPIVPAWLTPDDLAMRQNALHDRVEEVRARLEAAVEGSREQKTGLQPDPSTTPSANPSPEQARVLALIEEALPAVVDASTAMDRARSALASGRIDEGAHAEANALIALGRAIERFADLRRTLDLIKREHDRVLAMLDGAAAKDVKPAERAKAVKDGTAKNLERLARAADLLKEEVAKLEAQAAAQAAAPADPNQPEDPAAAEAAAKQLEAARAQLAHAEELRARATSELGALSAALGKGGDPIAPAKTAGATIDELRELFFSVIEHLQQLIREQSETRDRTTRAAGLDEIGRAPLLPELITRETEHAAIGQAIQDALAKQADAAAGDAGQTKNIAAAVDEVRLGVGEMQGARDQLAKAKEASNASYDLQPTLGAQAKALEHLANALRLLQPPKQDQQQQQQQQQQQDPQQADPQKDDPQEDQQDQAAKDQEQQDQRDPSGALQRVRDDEARRQRERREREHGQPEPVDKDW
jgi:hypothetical protein